MNRPSRRWVLASAFLCASVGALSSCNAPPSFTSDPPLLASVGIAYQYHASASGSPQPTFELVAAPAGMNVAEESGVVSWIPTADQVGLQPVTLRAANGVGTVEQSFTIDVQPSESAPVFTSTPVLVANVNVPYSYLAEASGLPVPSFEIATGPAGLTIEPASGAVLWTPTLDQLGGQPVTIRASNALGWADQTFTIDTQPEPPDTTPPTAPQNLHAEDTTTESYTMAWEAPPEGDAASYRIYERSFSNRQGYYSWNLAQSGVLGTRFAMTRDQIRWTGIFIVRALDAAGNESASSNQLASTFLTLPGIGHPMVGTSERPAAVLGEHLMLLMSPDTYPVEYLGGYEVSASGNPTPVVELISGPPGLLYSSSNGRVVWDPVTGDPGTQSVTLRASNVVGSTDYTFSFEVYPKDTDLIAPSSSAIQSVSSAPGGCNVTWSQANDAHGVAGYSIRGQRHYTAHPNSFGFVSNGTATSAFVNTVPAGTTGWTLFVSAFDAAGNLSYPNGGGSTCSPVW